MKVNGKEVMKHLKDKDDIVYIRPIEALFVVREWIQVEGFLVNQKQWDQLVKELVIDTSDRGHSKPVDSRSIDKAKEDE